MKSLFLFLEKYFENSKFQLRALSRKSLARSDL